MTTVTKRARLLLALCILISGIGCDQLTKQIATQQLRGSPSLSFLGDTVRLHYTENRGAFLGLGNRLSPQLRFWILTVATAVLLVGLSVFLMLQWNTASASFIALSFVLAGGIGNMLDRVFHDGRVIDFLNLGLGPLRTGVFNVADVAITGGIVVLWIVSFRTRAESKEPASS